MILPWIAFLVAATWMAAAGWRFNSLIDQMIDEVNARTDPKDRIQSFRVGRWEMLSVLDRHTRLYPVSEVRKRTYRWMGMFFGLWFVAALCFFTLVSG